MEFTKVQSRMFEEYPINIHKISEYVKGKKDEYMSYWESRLFH